LPLAYHLLPLLKKIVAQISNLVAEFGERILNSGEFSYDRILGYFPRTLSLIPFRNTFITISAALSREYDAPSSIHRVAKPSTAENNIVPTIATSTLLETWTILTPELHKVKFLTGPAYRPSGAGRQGCPFYRVKNF
jgi:hypothetical protein